MKNKTIISIMALVIMCMTPNQANAQFFKQLGKIAESVGKAVLDSATATEESAEGTPAAGNNTEAAATTSKKPIVTGHPDFKIEVKRCVASGTNLIIDLVVTNMGDNDVSHFFVHGGAYGYATKIYDNLGNIYEGDDNIYVKIANKEYTTGDYTISLISELPTNFSIMVKGFSSKATSLALVEPYIESKDWGINSNTVKLRNIPITRDE